MVIVPKGNDSIKIFSFNECLGCPGQWALANHVRVEHFFKVSSIVVCEKESPSWIYSNTSEFGITKSCEIAVANVYNPGSNHLVKKVYLHGRILKALS